MRVQRAADTAVAKARAGDAPATDLAHDARAVTQAGRKTFLVAGARPNFMKVAPLWFAMAAEPAHFAPRLVHAGQHYDPLLSDVFLRDLELPRPHIALGVGSGTHAQQTAGIMVAFERACLEARPDLVVVVGDVNSTLACALAAAKLGIPIAHVEAGLRSFDRSMPEEINRVVTDALSTYLFTPSRDADENLRHEGIDGSRIHRVGNVMIDSLLRWLPRISGLRAHAAYGLSPGGYAVLTLHRPSNVDRQSGLGEILAALEEIQRRLPVVFPLHPRTRKSLAASGLAEGLRRMAGVIATEPLGYLEFLSLVQGARFVMTDSGGVQEETTVLGVPCLTLREATERPITISEGTNQLVKPVRDAIIEKALEVLHGPPARPRAPELWDGRSAERIVQILAGAPAGRAVP